MRYLFLIILFLKFDNAFTQESEVNGKVSIFNSKFETGKIKYLQNVTVKETFNRSNEVLSYSDGTFKLTLVKVPEKTSITLNVHKNGWEVINTDRLKVIAGQPEVVEYYMSPIGKLEDNKLAYYKIGKTTGEKALQKKINEIQNEITDLKKEKNIDASKISNLEITIATLYGEKKNIGDNAIDLAGKFAQINLDIANNRTINAFKLFQSGEIKEAIELLNEDALKKDRDMYKKDIERGKALEQSGKALEQSGKALEQIGQAGLSQTVQSFILGANFFLSIYDFKRADGFYKYALEIEPYNYNYNFEYAAFLLRQNNHREAIAYFKKAIKLSNTSMDSIKCLNNIGNLYRLIDNVDSSKIIYKYVYKYLDTAKTNKAILLQRGINYNGLGIVYFRELNTDSALYYFHKSLNTKKEIILIDNNDDNLNEYGKTLFNLTAVYIQAYECDSALKFANESLNVYEKLVKNNYNKYIGYSTMALLDFGVYKRTCSNPIEALPYYKKCISLYENLISNDKESYLNELAGVYNNIGVMYSDLDSLELAAKAYKKAIDIRKNLIEKNPIPFTIDYCGSINNLCHIYARLNLKKKTLRKYCKIGLDFANEVLNILEKYKTHPLANKHKIDAISNKKKFIDCI